MLLGLPIAPRCRLLYQAKPEQQPDRGAGLRRSDMRHHCAGKQIVVFPEIDNGHQFTADEPCRVAELALAADYSMLAAYGSPEEVEARIMGIVNMVNELYADPRINIEHEVVELVIEQTNANTFGDPTAFDLGSFTSWAHGANGFQHDFDIAGMYWYSRGGGTVGRAGIAVICRTSSNSGHIVRDFSSSALRVTIDHAHELGHNWGAPHVGDASCIMYGSIQRDNTSWCASSIDAIVNHKSSRSCLTSCDRAPEAAFMVSDTHSCKGTVRFTDQSRYNPRWWLWDFGDGATSTERDPAHSYTTNGTYTVTLAVGNDWGSDTLTRAGYLTIDAPPAPQLHAEQRCSSDVVMLKATGTMTVKWYDALYGGVPLAESASFITPPLAAPTVYYVENAEAEKPTLTIGPSDTADGENGDYKDDPGHIYMVFETHAPVRFRSITVYANAAGTRHFLITTNNLRTTVAEKVVDIPEGHTVVDFDWELAADTRYELILENNPSATGDDGAVSYMNNLYRSRAGITYPVRIDGLISVTSNYWLESNPDAAGGWYVGYDWRVQELVECASARIPVVAGADCLTVGLPAHRAAPADGISINRARSHLLVHAGQPMHIDVFSLQGRKVYSWHGVAPQGHRIALAELGATSFVVRAVSMGREAVRLVGPRTLQSW